MRGLFLLAGLAAGCALPPARSPSSIARREALDGAARWLTGSARVVDGGLTWPADANRPDEVAPGPVDAGPIALLLAAGTVLDDTAHLAMAHRAARDLAARIPAALDSSATPPETSLYYGWPFAARVLERAGVLLADSTLVDAAREVVALTRRAAVRTSDTTVRWSPVYQDVLYGNAGTTLFMAWAARRFDDSGAGSLARLGATDLLTRAEDTRAGFGWRFRLDRPFVLPNFSHGAAGIGYTLLAVGRITGDRRFDRAAARAGRALTEAADTANGGIWVPYGWPEEAWQGWRDVGWAHGPAGTARLFLALDRVAPREAWLGWALRAGRGLASDPALLPGGVADSLPNDFRFGRAGVAWFLADLAAAGGSRPFRAASDAVGAGLLALATRDGAGVRWVEPRPSFMDHAGEPAAFTGLLLGTAGYGLTLARLEAPTSADPWDWEWLVEPASVPLPRR